MQQNEKKKKIVYLWSVAYMSTEANNRALKLKQPSWNFKQNLNNKYESILYWQQRETWYLKSLAGSQSVQPEPAAC